MAFAKCLKTYDPTIEDSYTKRTSIDGELSIIDILDTAGQEEYSLLKDNWIPSGEGYLVVYSIISREGFDRIEHYLDTIKKVREIENWDRDRPPIVLVGNKVDTAYAGREVSTSEAQDLANRRGLLFYETSAKIPVNVTEAFEDVVRAVKKKRKMRSPFKAFRWPKNWKL